MKTKTIKTEMEALDAIATPPSNGRPPVEVTFKDGSTITEIRIGLLVISSPYGLTVVREVDREEQERYRVRVDHPNFPSLNRYFESEYESRDFARPFENIDGATVDGSMVKVLVDASGKIIAELDGETVKPLTPQESGGDDIPF